jgi:galactokinase
MDVPAGRSFADIYPQDAIPSQKARWELLRIKFEKEYGHAPEFISRSPGRVNLIGEHIDYSLYEVLPMAVTVDALVAFSVTPESSTIRLSNVISDQFPSRVVEINSDNDVDIDDSRLEWSNYFKAGFRGVSKYLQKKYGSKKLVGMSILVDGTVPAGGGLSSSSAFVCASSLAVMAANGETKVDKKELCELAIISERAVGVYGGGMDQAASVFSLVGSASYVSFVPTLQVTPVAFPKTEPELAFIVAQSFVTSDKHVTAPVCYNLRVVECTIAAAVLTKIFGLKADLPRDSSPLGSSLRGFQDLYYKEKEGIDDNIKTSIDDFQKQLDNLHLLVEDYLPQEEGYNREQIASILNITVDELNKRYMSKFPVRADYFKLRQRALHVFGEASRVIKFRKMLASSSASNANDQVLKDLGKLMNETQDSCRDGYECSCEELDELCALAREAGSYGSRLTGAGWGGGSVHLVAKDKIDKVTQIWEERYYRKRWPDISDERLREAVVVSEPGSGSYLYKVADSEVH